MEAAIHSIQSELEETIRHRVEDVLSYVDQKRQDLCKELTEKIEEHRWIYRQ
jgi:DNA-binding ferritin-like protein